MDNLHKPEEYPFISPVVVISQFLATGREAAASVCGPVDVENSSASTPEAFYAHRIGCPEALAKDIIELCDVEKLKCGLENEDGVDDTIPAEGQEHLVTLELQSREYIKRKTLSYRQMVCHQHKYKRTNFRVLDSIRDDKEEKGIPLNYVPDDVILTVVLCQPYCRPLEYHEIRLGRLLSMDSTFYVRGDTPLAALRDKISCLSDWSTMEDCSENPDVRPEQFSKDVYKGGLFYINGIFYNDMRDPNATDLCKPILEWAARRQDAVGPFATSCMAETKFRDLHIRLGQPYLYLHQGSCEHLMIFTDLRMMTWSDSEKLEDYPLLTSLKPKKRMPCCACKIYTAKWLTFNNSDLPFDPGFFCDSCFRMFKYDKDNKKVDDFKAVPYFDRSVLI